MLEPNIQLSVIQKGGGLVPIQSSSNKGEYFYFILMTPGGE